MIVKGPRKHGRNVSAKSTPEKVSGFGICGAARSSDQGA